MKFIIEIPGNRENDLRTIMELLNPGELAITKVAQDEHGRTAEMVWVEQFYEGELRVEMPDIVHWGELAEETREGIGEIMAGQATWQFQETHPLDVAGIAARIRHERPEVMGTPESIPGLLWTSIVRRPDLGDLLESIIEIITGEPIPQGKLVQNGAAARVLEAVPRLGHELLRARARTTLPDDTLPGILDAMNDESHRIAREMEPGEASLVLAALAETAGGGEQTDGPIILVTVQDVIDRYNGVIAGGDGEFPEWDGLTEAEQARLVENCRLAMPRNPGALIRRALLDNPPVIDR